MVTVGPNTYAVEKKRAGAVRKGDRVLVSNRQIQAGPFVPTAKVEVVLVDRVPVEQRQLSFLHFRHPPTNLSISRHHPMIHDGEWVFPLDLFQRDTGLLVLDATNVSVNFILDLSSLSQ